jgi:hypothetical protein
LQAESKKKRLMYKKVLFLGTDPTSVRDTDRQTINQLGADAGYKVVITGDRERFNEFIDGVVIAAGNVPRERLIDAPALRWFQQLGTGSEWLIPMTALRQSNLVFARYQPSRF